MVLCTNYATQFKREGCRHFKLFDSIIKPFILYACKCWGYSLKKDIFVNKTETFHMGVCKCNFHTGIC